jgi:hypothetical protein
MDIGCFHNPGGQGPKHRKPLRFIAGTFEGKPDT